MGKLLAPNHPVSLLYAPVLWILHFVLCYSIVSVACKFAADTAAASIALANLAIAALTAGALAGMAYLAWLNWRKRRAARQASDRMSQFFAVNSLLLCGLSALALVWVAFPAAVLPTCAS